MLNEISVSDFFVNRVAEKAGIDISNYPMKDLISGFENEMELHNRLRINPVETLKIIIQNLKRDPRFYQYKYNFNKHLKEQDGIHTRPKVSHTLIVKSGVDNMDEQKIELVKKFIIFVSQNLNLTEPCKIFFSAERNKHLATTASYNPNNHNIWIYVKNRNMLGDILRSLAHEMMHFKQMLRNEITNESGNDGSPQENEANTFSGIMIRKFGRMFPEIYY